MERGSNFDAFLTVNVGPVAVTSQRGRRPRCSQSADEDNLPSYHRDIYESFGTDGAWGTWIGSWTPRRDPRYRDRDIFLTTRAVDPSRSSGSDGAHDAGLRQPVHLDMLHTVAYVSFQELATRISHRNTGRFTQDPVCEQLLSRIAQDENLHMVFYRNVLASALELAPDETM